MRKAICVVVRNPPYGGVQAFEAWRHVRGGAESGFTMDVLLVDDGVYLAVAPATDGPGEEWMNLSIAFGGLARGDAEDGQVRVAASREDLAARGLQPEDVLPGVEVVGREEVAARVAAMPVMVY